MLNGECSERAMLAVPTDASGSGYGRLWPTPTVQDSANNGGAAQIGRHTPPLNAAAGGALSPPWVEWLMGWPCGWTDLKPLDPEIVRDWLERQRQAWTPCPCCDDFACTIHAPLHAFECECSPIEEWARDPYSAGWWTEDPADRELDPIPRIASGVPKRRHRLSAIGNGQVPLCAATAWEILT